MWQHLSPLAWKHINLVGSYHFTDVHLEGDFRPLRELESRRIRQEKRVFVTSSTTEDQKKWDKDSYGERKNPEEEPVVQLSLLENVGSEDDEQTGERL